MNTIIVCGPKDKILKNSIVINTTSHSKEDWQKDLSPFFLGPIHLYENYKANILENAWQYAKVYSDCVDSNGEPNDNYWLWAKKGWLNNMPVRYPRGKGAKPLYCYWNGLKLDYISARLKVYFPLYRNAVRETAGYKILKKLYKRTNLYLWDFDGYQIKLSDALKNPNKPMGHAFVLKSMLLYGDDVTPEFVLQNSDKYENDFDY